MTERRIKLEQHLQLLLLDQEGTKISDWFQQVCTALKLQVKTYNLKFSEYSWCQVGDKYLQDRSLGDSLVAAQMLQEKHAQFELQVRVNITKLNEENSV